jgi:RHS repeat-associated protein
MTITLTRPIIQVADYYPFGYEIEENSYENILEQKNNYLYNGIEEQDDFGLNTYMAEFRMYDPMLGRWWQQDLIIKFHESPYAWVTNNPILFADPFGLDSVKYDDLVVTPFDTNSDVVILDEVVVEGESEEGSEEENSEMPEWIFEYESPNVKRAIQNYYDPNIKASGAVEPFYFVPNPIESAISFGANIQQGHLLIAGLALIDVVPGGKHANKFRKILGIPDNWIAKASKKSGGIRYMNPNNPNDWVRIMPGNPSAPNPVQRVNYVKRSYKGSHIDKFGNKLPSGKVPEAHIPLSEFKFK